jgi:hypothetical protein
MRDKKDTQSFDKDTRRKSSLRWQTRTLKDNINMDLKETGSEIQRWKGSYSAAGDGTADAVSWGSVTRVYILCNTPID